MIYMFYNLSRADILKMKQKGKTIGDIYWMSRINMERTLNKGISRLKGYEYEVITEEDINYEDF